MKIDNQAINSVFNTFSNTKPFKAKSDEFKNLLNQTKPNTDANITQMSVEDFKEALKKYGAAGFIAKINEDIIDEKLAQKRTELEESMGLNDNSKSTDEKRELMAIIDDLMLNYEKELKAKLKENAILQKQQQLNANKSVRGLEMALAEI